MPTATLSRKTLTFADKLRKIGDVPLSRIRIPPCPATEKDAEAIQAHEDRTFEIVDGILVEKAMGFRESLLAIRLAIFLNEFVTPRKLGIIAGADGMMKLAVRLVRAPDVSFISWDRIPERKVPKEPIPRLAPDLAVEVLSEGNTLAEMKRKLKDYFKADVSLVWIVDPETRTVAVHTSPKKPTILVEDDTLDGGDVLPGFTLSLRELFATLDQEGPN